MAELTAISSSVNTIFKLAEFASAYNEVSRDAAQLLKSVELADRKVNHAKRLRSTKSEFLENHFKQDVDADISAAEEIVNSIGNTIERCRVDLETNSNRVKPLNKLKWLFRDNHAFRSKGWSLTNALNALVSDIQVMESIHQIPTVIEPPSYHESQKFHKPLRSPSSRRELIKRKSDSSLADMNESTESQKHVNDIMLVHTYDGYLSTGQTTRTDWPNYSNADYRIDHSSDDQVFWTEEVPLEMPMPLGGLFPNEPWTYTCPPAGEKITSRDKVVELQGQMAPARRPPPPPPPRRWRSACIR